MAPTTRRFALALEGLEAREVPAVHVSVLGHTLDVSGGELGNTIAIRDDGHGGITVDAGGEHVTATGIHRIEVATGAGRDRVSYQLTKPLAETESIDVRLGTGADVAKIDLTAGVASDGHLKLDVHGGAGADREAIRMGGVAAGGSAEVNARGGRGADHLAVYASGTVAGRLATAVYGGAGHDTEHVYFHDRITDTGHLSVRTR